MIALFYQENLFARYLRSCSIITSHILYYPRALEEPCSSSNEGIFIKISLVPYYPGITMDGKIISSICNKIGNKILLRREYAEFSSEFCFFSDLSFFIEPENTSIKKCHPHFIWTTFLYEKATHIWSFMLMPYWRIVEDNFISRLRCVSRSITWGGYFCLDIKITWFFHYTCPTMVGKMLHGADTIWQPLKYIVATKQTSCRKLKGIEEPTTI